MRYLDRSKVAVPPPLRDGTDGQPAPRLAWYHDLHKKDGRIHDRWNNQDLGENSESSTRQSLRQLSEDRCAYCEALLEKGWQVDHYLPLEHHPYLAYHFDNLLPTCPGCNNRKRSYDSGAGIRKQFVDPILASEHPEALPFDKTAVLPGIANRLLDPSFDRPEQHLRFVPETLSWEGLSTEGRTTVLRVLAGDKDRMSRWQKLSDKIKANIEEGTSDRLMAIDAELIGFPTAFGVLVSYWKEMLAPVLQRSQDENS